MITKRLLFVGNQWPPETFLLRLMDGLADAGHAVCVQSDRRPPADWLRRPNHAWRWGPSWNVPPPWRLLNLLRLLLRFPPWRQRDSRLLARLVRQQSGSRERLRALYRLLPVSRPDCDLVYFPWILAAEGYLDWFTGLGIPVVVSLRGSMVNVDPHIPGEGEAVQLALRRVLQGAAAVHCVSQDILDEAIQYGLDPAKARVIRPAVDPAFFVPTAVPHANLRFTVITTGSLIWRKGYEYSLLAMRQLVDGGVDAEFHIIGDGPELQRILYTVMDLNLQDRVILHGKLPPEQVRVHLQHADVFLLSSLSEGISNAVLEAMSCSLPVVTTDCGGMREAVADGVEGFIVPVRDPFAAAGSVKILATNQDLRNQMGIAARQRVLKEFTLEKQIEDWKDLLSNALLESSQP